MEEETERLKQAKAQWGPLIPPSAW
jgi:hypothetical protein